MTGLTAPFLRGFYKRAKKDPTINLTGKADHMPDSRYPRQELKKGRKHEKEHTNNPQIAEQIAKDHLEEDRHYYSHLEQAKIAFWEGFKKEASLKGLIMRAPHKVYIRKIFSEKTKSPSRRFMAGGFHYSFTPDGPIAGKVGAGMSHTLKKDIALNPDKYVGKAVSVKAHRSGKNDTLITPSFSGWGD